MSPVILTTLLKGHGCTRLLAKRLSPNDNSKNQIYLGGDYTAIQLLPFGRLLEDDSEISNSKNARLKASIAMFWLNEAGQKEPATHANLILYPKYPEVRLSGILAGLRTRAPSSVIASRDTGRWLLLGIIPDGSVLAYACAASTPCARWAEECAESSPLTGIFYEFALVADNSLSRIQDALRMIAARGWIDSKRLDREGALHPCLSQNCGGYTLEAELGIRPNGRAEPDYEGWEVKQFNVKNLDRPVGSQVTLFTPEPDGGVYTSKGTEAFLRQYGYPDQNGVVDRINFGGAHKFEVLHPLTQLTLQLDGWNVATRKVESLSGGIQLIAADGQVAAKWSFTDLINHWKRKHAKAVYVPSLKKDSPRSYQYGTKVFAGMGADFPLVLDSITKGELFYDPAIKMEQASQSSPAIKRRSQFRILFRNIGSLYEKTEWWDLG